MWATFKRVGLVLLLAAGIAAFMAGCLGITQNPSYFPRFLPTGDIVRTHAKPPGWGPEHLALGSLGRSHRSKLGKARLAYAIDLTRRVLRVPASHRIGIVHDAGTARGRLERQRIAFPGCAAVVFGHSHIPLHETAGDGAFQIFNPGSPTDRRRQPRHTMGEAVVAGGAIRFGLIVLD